MRITWHEPKNRLNVREHGISFEEAQTIFLDPLASTVDDPDHSWYERRYLTIGHTSAGRLVVVSHTIEVDKVRIISARKPTGSERKDYEG